MSDGGCRGVQSARQRGLTPRRTLQELAMERWLRRIMVQGLLVTFGTVPGAPGDVSALPLSAAAAVGAGASREAAAQKGRYKKEGDNCVWDASDSGPNQCEPLTKGRFKKDGDRCVWEFNESGPDQCTPRGGRFKKEGDRCVWAANDSGPNQCNPRKPR